MAEPIGLTPEVRALPHLSLDPVEFTYPASTVWDIRSLQNLELLPYPLPVEFILSEKSLSHYVLILGRVLTQSCFTVLSILSLGQGRRVACFLAKFLLRNIRRERKLYKVALH